jgi:hypothetical protein
LGQWAVSRKKSEQWRVKSEQKKQNKMRGAVSVEQWAEKAKEDNSFWFYRFARSSGQWTVKATGGYALRPHRDFSDWQAVLILHILGQAASEL